MKPVLGALLPALVLIAGCAHRDTLALLEQEGATAGESGAVAVLDPETGAEIGVVDRANVRARLTPGRVTARTSRKPLETRYAAVLGTLPPPPRTFILHFVLEKAELDDESKAMLPGLFAEIRDRAGADVAIVGHTDAAGTERFNDELSENRALETVRLLEAQGLDVDIVEAIGRGARDPIAPNGPKGHQPLNRRVEVIVR